MNKEYLKGYKKAIKYFEDTINIGIDDISEDPSELTLIRVVDSIISTMYIVKMFAEEMEEDINVMSEFNDVNEETLCSIDEMLEDIIHKIKGGY